MASKKDSTLRAQLLRAGKNRWLDVGCGDSVEEGFLRMDNVPVKQIPAKHRRGYIRYDILKLTNRDAAKFGKFDLIRMQHVFEHFTFEEGRIVLANCAKLLKRGGIILMTVPDLEIHIRNYLRDKYRTSSFRWWANERIGENAPNSFYFSMFTHSWPQIPHKWCYDFAGLRFQLKQSGQYTSVRRLDRKSPLASNPFTHNRPDEDVCAMAVRR